MAGNTATINVQAFRADWASHKPISWLCVAYTVTKDQVYRLRDHWHLPLRNDRRLRYKPERGRDPTPDEIAERAAAIRATWDADTEVRRRGATDQIPAFDVPEVEVPLIIRLEIEGR
jgi:hypothetical protein